MVQNGKKWVTVAKMAQNGKISLSCENGGSK